MVLVQIPGSRLTELFQIFGVPEHLFTEISDEDKQEIDIILQAEKNEYKETVLFSQYDAALKNERNTISRIDYYLKGKGREFIKFEDLIVFIAGEAGMFNRILDVISDDSMRPVLYAIVKAFNMTSEESNHTERLISLKRSIDQTFENYQKMNKN